MKSIKMDRRKFIGNSSRLAMAGMAAPMILQTKLFGAEAANNKLNIGCIGLGGQMQGLMEDVLLFGQNIVALCDVDSAQIEKTRKRFPEKLGNAKAYKDYRELFAQEKSLDAVVIATPDHWHATICAAAMHAGKNVYCEKPLAHTVGEARRLREISRETGVVTQTGNQGSASSNFRLSMELVQAGVLGEVTDVYAWHPKHGWPHGESRPATPDAIPETLDWDMWLGPAPERPYSKAIYHPAQWRGWYDFGGGSLADFCCHSFSMPVRSLKLDYPEKIEISGTGMGMESFPTKCKVDFSFPAKDGRGPVSIHFITGGDLPPSEATVGMAETFGNVRETGCLMVGSNGTLAAGLWNNECFVRLKGDKEFRAASDHPALDGVPKSLPRAPRERHMLEFIEACKGQGTTFSPFEIGGHVTEIGAAGLVALRSGQSIHWKGSSMKVPGLADASKFIKPQHRKTWGV